MRFDENLRQFVYEYEGIIFAWDEEPEKDFSDTVKKLAAGYYERLDEECRRDGYRALIACVTEGNAASDALHLRLGFKKVSHFKKVGLKFGRWLDVVDYELLLS